MNFEMFLCCPNEDSLPSEVISWLVTANDAPEYLVTKSLNNGSCRPYVAQGSWSTGGNQQDSKRIGFFDSL